MDRFSILLKKEPPPSPPPKPSSETPPRTLSGRIGFTGFPGPTGHTGIQGYYGPGPLLRGSTGIQGIRFYGRGGQVPPQVGYEELQAGLLIQGGGGGNASEQGYSGSGPFSGFPRLPALTTRGPAYETTCAALETRSPEEGEKQTSTPVLSLERLEGQKEMTSARSSSAFSLKTIGQKIRSFIIKSFPVLEFISTKGHPSASNTSH